MLALLLALQNVTASPPLANSVDGYPVGAIEPSAEIKGCTAFLWVRGNYILIAEAYADRGAIRLAVDGTPATYPITAQNGIGAKGFSRTTEYRNGKTVVTLDLALTTRPGGDVQIGESTLKVERGGKPAVSVPVAGMISCA